MGRESAIGGLTDDASDKDAETTPFQLETKLSLLLHAQTRHYRYLDHVINIPVLWFNRTRSDLGGST